MAAIGGVREASSVSSDLYFWTMSKSGLRNCRPFVFDGDLACCFNSREAADESS